MKKQAKQAKPVVGFYRDKDDKMKPITKSVAELNRKKFVENGQGSKDVDVVTRVRDNAQILEDLLGDLHLAQDHLVVLNEQQRQLLAEGKQNPVVDGEVEKTNEQIRLLKNRIRGLRSQHI